MNYFLTFRTYGTWLHGDQRGSVDREHNQYGEPLLDASLEREQRARRMMRASPCLLNEAQRDRIIQTIDEVATFRSWHVHAVAVLSNHVHVVVSVPDQISAERALNDFKIWSTRRLREHGLVERGRKIWERHGSTRHLRRDSELSAACDYVLNRQHHRRPAEGDDECV